MNGSFQRASADLVTRIEKEIARGPLPRNDGGDTAAIGGWGKIGRAIETLLASLFEDLAGVSGMALKEARREYGVPEKAMIGKLVDPIIEVSEAAAKHAALTKSQATIVADLRRDSGSALLRLADVRHRLVHSGAKWPTPVEASEALTRALTLLRGRTINT